MCGIAGFSLTPNSRIKSRQLANAMLTAIEDRGYMASGFGYWYKDQMGYHSEAKPGSALSLKFLPRKAETVILHTRLATHGSVNDNRNNHPVTSPSGAIALVHNGVIYNHDTVRKTIDGKLPDVDTSVIPAIIEQQGIGAINKLDGDAAIAWLDRSQQGVMHLARYQHSPLTMAQLEDGSFVFASTEALLWRVLIQLDLAPMWMQEAKELDYFTIKNGIIMSQEMLPEPAFVEQRYNYNYYRNQTSGAKNTPAWDDEAWEDEAEWEMHNANTPYYDSVYYGDEEDIEDVEPILQNKYWTTVKEHLAKSVDYLYYDSSERELWINELYFLSQDKGLTLIDYGSVEADGQLVSSMTQDILF